MGVMGDNDAPSDEPGEPGVLGVAGVPPGVVGVVPPDASNISRPAPVGVLTVLTCGVDADFGDGTGAITPPAAAVARCAEAAAAADAATTRGVNGGCDDASDTSPRKRPLDEV